MPQLWALRLLPEINAPYPHCFVCLDCLADYSGAFKIVRLYALDSSGDDLASCPGPAFDSALVPETLLPELECTWNSYAGEAWLWQAASGCVLSGC